MHQQERGLAAAPFRLLGLDVDPFGLDVDLVALDRLHHARQSSSGLKTMPVSSLG